MSVAVRLSMKPFRSAKIPEILQRFPFSNKRAAQERAEDIGGKYEMGTGTVADAESVRVQIEASGKILARTRASASNCRN